MGASSWCYVEDWSGSVPATLARLRQKSFEAGDWLWDEAEDDPNFPKPQSFDDWQRSEYVGVPGAHSIVDIVEVFDGDDLDEADHGQTVPLTGDELIELFGTTAPSSADWEHFGGTQNKALWDVALDRWIGRHVVLVEEGRPSKVAFWGYSGD